MHLERFAVLEESTILDCIKLFYTFNANVIPVLSRTENYLGYVAYDDVFGDCLNIHCFRSEELF
jgi:Mg/Co/Ni transporter MgtE